MIKLSFKNGLNSVDLIRGHGKTIKGYPHSDMSECLMTIRQGTTITVENPNPHIEPHRGKYYLLFVQEINTVFLFYLDVKFQLRYVYSGNLRNAASAIYSNIADGTELTILKSDGKRAYRVAMNQAGELLTVPTQYRNKSSKMINQTYMNLFDAINWAVACHGSHYGRVYYVVTKDDGIMFQVG